MSQTHDARVPPVAIVGMACIFPGAPDLATFWSNIEAGHDAVTDVPPSRWEPQFYDPDASSPDRFYCKRGGFVDAFAEFDPLAFGIMPVAARGAEPDQLLGLKVASRALADAGYPEGKPVGANAGVILGRGGYITPGMTRLVQQVRTAQQLVEVLRTLAPGLGSEQLAAIKQSFQAGARTGGPDAAIGLVPNLAASRIANRLDLHGPAYTVDAACASSLVAVDQACRELRDRRCDLVLAGGVHLTHDVTFWSVFVQLGVLSRSQQMRPFDRRADGLLMGEGVGLVVLRRLEDALRDGDRIYAVIRGTGISSDGRETSLMQPSVDGQVVALRRAWEAAGLDPRSVGLVEAHGTSTPAGDAAEIETLTRVFGPADGSRRAGLGSVKSMIGHAMPAAGAAGLIKAALAIHHGVLPPTLHCEEPRPELEKTRFRPVRAAESWEEDPRRAGVSAFGFGGINAHVVLESAGPARKHAPAVAADERPVVPRLLTAAAASPRALLERIEAGATGGEGPARLAVLDPDPDRLDQAKKVVSRGKPWRGRKGVWFSPDGLVSGGGRIAFLFPGVDASFKPRVDDVAAAFGYRVPDHTEATELEEIGLGIIGINRLLDRVLRELGILPDAIAGHSIGEWSGMIASGMIPGPEVDAFIASLTPGSLEVPGVAFAAAGCTAEKAEAIIRDLHEIAVSHDNCPHQVILCGHEDSIETATGRLRQEGILCQVLPFRSGFHSPLFADYLGPHRQHLENLTLVPPAVPLWSATTCAPYPSGVEAIKSLAVEHLVRPVRFSELVLRLHEEGFRVFLQVGTGSLVGFVDDILKGKPHLAMRANDPQRPGLEQLWRLAAALYVEGVAVDLGRLGPRAEGMPAGEGTLRLELGVPLVTLDDAAPPVCVPTPLAAEGDPLLAEFGALQQEMIETHRAVAEALAARRVDGDSRSAATRVRRTLSVVTVPALRDHSFFPQPADWPVVADGYPVVPMTMSLALMMQAAESTRPGSVAVRVENLRATKWLVVEPPVEVAIAATPDSSGRIRVAIEGYSEAEVVLADGYPPAPRASVPALEEPRPPPVDARTLYADRWMFHGPRYQGVVAMGPMGRNGIHGEIETPAAPGALLDNAGQLFGFWVMACHDRDRLAMPVQIARLDFFGPDPRVGERLECDVRVREVGDREVGADIELHRDGRVWCRITGWDDRRFDSDPHVWEVLQRPEKNLLSSVRPSGYAFYDDGRIRAPSRDWLGRRYLGESERREMIAAGPRRARQWLNGRIAAKDAIRHAVWQEAFRPIFPVEIRLDHSPEGAPLVRGPFDADVRVSLAHSGDVAVALAALGRDVGIDVERIEERSPTFEEVALAATERDLIAQGDRDAWLTRFWCAKEAVAKARRTGLSGKPKRFVVTEVAGDRLLVDGTWVRTAIEGTHVVAWTES